ncbi:MAG: hypothetical protein ACKPKO_19245 [Candidatus Fonsibacter sp.]
MLYYILMSCTPVFSGCMIVISNFDICLIEFLIIFMTNLSITSTYIIIFIHFNFFILFFISLIHSSDS